MGESPTPAERFRIALELHDLGMKIMRQNLRRARPEASEAEIDAALVAWLQDRPPDCPGRPRPWPLTCEP